MISLLKNINNFKYSNKIAVTICDSEKILETKTFGDIFESSETFEEKLLYSLKNKNHCCIGLLMEKNVYFPSIIICLQKMKHSFVCLSKNKTNEMVPAMNLDYIISFNIDDVSNFVNVETLTIEADKRFILWKNLEFSNKQLPYSFINVFSILQTSGTTGVSKTVRIPHNCIESNGLSLGKIFKVRSSDVIFWGTPLSFDPSLIELLLALINQASLVIVPYMTYINPRALFTALFNISQVTLIQMVPSVFLRWDETLIEQIFLNSSLRILAFGGEAFPKQLLKYERRKDLLLFNLYGITEVSCWATAHCIIDENEDNDIPIGHCLEDTIIEVRDANGEVVKDGDGEIYIGSLTRKCYIDNETDGVLPMFRETGDLCHKQNNKIYYKGRKNKIIKRYGHRINLTKIEETVFKECGLLSKCVSSEKTKKLLLFILIKDSYTRSIKENTVDKIRSKLICALSRESFPDYFDLLETFPTTSHGKINEKKLEEYYLMRLPSSSLESSILFCNLWFKYLGIGTNFEYFERYSFFEMGGNSINILQLISEFKTLTNIDSTELVTAVFEKKLSDCKNLIANGNFAKIRNKKRADGSILNENIFKKQKAKNLAKNDIKIVWKYDLKACIDAPPVVFTDSFDNVRVAAGSFCNILAVFCENGTEVFKSILTGSIESAPTISFCKKHIYVGCYDGTMYCASFNENKIIWKFKTSDKIKSSALLLQNGERMVFGSYDKYVYCLLTQDGSVIWKIKVAGSVSANLVFHKIYGIFAATTSGICYCISESDGKIIWTYNCRTPIFGTPCTDHEELLVVPSVLGVLFGLSMKTGELVWKFKANGHIFSSVVKFKDCIVFGCHDKHIYVLKISGSDSVLIGKVLLNSEISSTPCMYQKDNFSGILAAVNIGIIYLINFDNLLVVEEIKLPGEVFSSPVVYENKVYVGCRDNHLYCLSLD